MGDDIQKPVSSKITTDISDDSKIGSKRNILELEQKILQLEETIKQRDLYIDKVTKEKLSAENEKVKYLKEITQKNNEISELKNRNLALEDRISKMIDDNKAEFEKKEKEIANLQAKLNELASANGVDKEVIKRLEELSIRYSSLKEELMVKDQELTRIRVEHFAEKYLSSELKKELDTLREQYLKVQEENNELKQKLDIVNNKVQASFTPSQLSNYLSNAIDNFNKQANTSNKAVNYVINGMDVEFKATMAKDDANQMILDVPEIANNSEDALSTIKLSIRAVPKTNN